MTDHRGATVLDFNAAAASTAAVRARARRVKEAIKAEMALEVDKSDPGWRAYKAAVRQAEQLEDDFSTFALELLTRPVATVEDLRVRAEIAKFWCLEEYGSTDDREEAIKSLIAGVISYRDLSPLAR